MSFIAKPLRGLNIIDYGPPDPTSNIRPIKSEQPGSNELEERLVELRKQIYEMNHEFWKEQNTKYEKEKHEFIAQELKRKGQDGKTEARLNADELSPFYQSFLSKYFSIQFEYFKKWHQLNITYIVLSIRTSISNVFKYKRK
ncbi:cytochrome c oxidase assembly factor 8-like [Dysidea avara]|uniref:cytochrome c oxidase assembly factor 8-like n=1 Tax=Dysidea avara TaxID=196820 RepID=UPI0033251231